MTAVSCLCNLHGDWPAAVRHLRTTLKCSQQQFSAALGISASTVHRWECGRAHPAPLARRALTDFAKTQGIALRLGRGPL